MERARQGDQAAFRELVDRHRDRAYGLALRMLRSPADAEEVAQDAFVSAWRALPGFRGDARFGTWLHKIVVRRALDRAETLRNRRGREVALESVAEPPAAPQRELAGDRAQQASEVAALLSRLSEAQRAVVMLFYYQERSIEEVSLALNMPTGTVKTHLSRARAALREAWIRAGWNRTT